MAKALPTCAASVTDIGGLVELTERWNMYILQKHLLQKF